MWVPVAVWQVRLRTAISVYFTILLVGDREAIWLIVWFSSVDLCRDSFWGPGLAWSYNETEGQLKRCWYVHAVGLNAFLKIFLVVQLDKLPSVKDQGQTAHVTVLISPWPWSSVPGELCWWPIHIHGNVTSAGWQVTLCDLIWHVSSRSGEASCELLYSVYLYLTFYMQTRSRRQASRGMPVRGMHRWVDRSQT